MIRIQTTPRFEKAYKKLRPNQQSAVDEAIDDVVANPSIGKGKKGDLTGMRVYKFSMVNQLALLGYAYIENELVVVLFAVGPHENFYRDLKR